MHPHDLTGKAQAYAAAFGLGGEERDEDILLACGADRRAIIADVDDGVVALVQLGGDLNVSRTGLGSVLHKVDQDLGDLALVGVQQHVLGLLHETGGRSGGCQNRLAQIDDLGREVASEKRLPDRHGHVGQIPVRIDKLYKTTGRTGDGLQTCLEIRPV